MPVGYERISVEMAAVGRITLSRPDKRNAIDRQMLAELIRAVRESDAEKSIRVVVIAGAGAAFSSGVDLDQAAEARAAGESAFEDFLALGDEAMAAVEGMRAVTIAAVHGNCVGAGMLLAAACDLRIASEDAVFSLPETRLGFPVVWGGIPLLLRHLGPAAVKDLVMTSRVVDAAEAFRLGFVTRIAATEPVEQAAESLAADLAGMPGQALSAAKRMIGLAMQGRLGHQDELAEALAILREGGEPIPGR